MKYTLFILTFGLLCFTGCTHIHSQTTQPTYVSSATSPEKPETLPNTPAQEALPTNEEPILSSSKELSGHIFGLISKIVLFLALLGGGGYCLIKLTQGKGLFQLSQLTGFKKENNLKVLETKMLGNKQFLVVVEYDQQKILLGVGPGSMQHLCNLNKAERPLVSSYQ